MFLCSDGLPQKIWKNKSVGPLQVKTRTTTTKTTATTINCLRHELWFRKLEGQYFDGIALRNRKYYLTRYFFVDKRCCYLFSLRRLSHPNDKS